jgi:hypothetical protein
LAAKRWAGLNLKREKDEPAAPKRGVRYAENRGFRYPPHCKSFKNLSKNS